MAFLALAYRNRLFLYWHTHGPYKSSSIDTRISTISPSNLIQTSPTVATHALMATCLIDAIEGRYVATDDIPRALLQADMDEDVWIKFEGEMVDILVSIDEDLYGPCVCQYKNKRFLYANAKKAIYGCLRSAFLFYQIFTGELKTHTTRVHSTRW